MHNIKPYKKLALYAIIGGQFLVFSPVFADVNQNILTGTKSIGEQYQNLSGAPKFVAVSVTNTDTAQNTRINCVSSPTTSTTSQEVIFTTVPPTPAAGFFVSRNSCTFLVPNNYYYGVWKGTVGTTPTISVWTEWDMPIGSSTVVVYNPNQDVYNLVLLMWGMVFFVIWFFKIDRKNKSS